MYMDVYIRRAKRRVTSAVSPPAPYPLYASDPAWVLVGDNSC